MSDLPKIKNQIENVEIIGFESYSTFFADIDPIILENIIKELRIIAAKEYVDREHGEKKYDCFDYSFDALTAIKKCIENTHYKDIYILRILSIIGKEEESDFKHGMVLIEDKTTNRHLLIEPQSPTGKAVILEEGMDIANAVYLQLKQVMVFNQRPFFMAGSPVERT